MVHFPDNDHLINYIVARPHVIQVEDRSVATPVHIHAEKTLLSHFDTLKDEYPKSRSISTVLFYSRLMPCSGCTNLLIQKFKKCPYKVVVVYNNDWKKALEEDKNKENRNKLREVGIDVYRVHYQRILPPMQSQQ